MKNLFAILSAVVLTSTLSLSVSAFAPGGAADTPAIESFSTWTQFASPDTQTPAIDETGCLDYSLAKIAVRYNLPLDGADVFDTSYTYYTEFVEEAIHPAYTKAVYFSEHFAPLVRFEEQVPINADTASQSWEQAYEYCHSLQGDIPRAFVLEMHTASGSSHFVAVESLDPVQERLYLYDSGDRFSEYLGDSVSQSRGYHVESIYTIKILTVPGDADGDAQITLSDAVLLGMLLMHDTKYDLRYDANQDGLLTAEDTDYITRYAQYTQLSAEGGNASIK
ncbi:MAG: hypothetical protein IJ496_07895 [Ruminococcus sp.]|nr:hypothetical protein [Ruminococcus sp.]